MLGDNFQYSIFDRDTEEDLIETSSASEKPKVFQEKEFINYFFKLIECQNYENALTYLIECLPELSKRKINRKEKLNHLLYMSRLIQSGSGGKYGYEKLFRKANGLKNRVANLEIPSEGSFVEFGCGAHDPIALSSYFYINGFDRCFAIDLLKPRNAVYSSLSMYDILANMTMLPDQYRWRNSDVEVFQKRLKDFDVKKFATGDFYGGFKLIEDRINYKTCNILEVGLNPSEVSLLTSFAVFEHVTDIEEVCKYLYELMMPGGISYHFVDLADHRSYRNTGEYNAFTFLTEEEAPANMNRARKSEIVEAFKASGFEIVVQDGEQMEMPQETRDKLLPKWEKMSEEDRLTVKLHLVLRKPI